MNNTEEEFNIALGQRLSLMRRSKRMSMDELGDRIGVRGQQIFKYETGENRISPERLAQCARIFDVPVGYFYGENENDQQVKRYDRVVLNAVAEISAMPYEIRTLLFDLCRSIKKANEPEQFLLMKTMNQA